MKRGRRRQSLDVDLPNIYTRHIVNEFCDDSRHAQYIQELMLHMAQGLRWFGLMLLDCGCTATLERPDDCPPDL